MLRLTAGTIQQFQVAAGNVLSAALDLETPELSSSKTRRRWEAIATILNAVVTALLPAWGFDAYQLYQAAIGRFPTLASLGLSNSVVARRCGLSKLVDAKREQWVTIGQSIARQLERPEFLPEERSVFDPIFLACEITRRR